DLAERAVDRQRVGDVGHEGTGAAIGQRHRLVELAARAGEDGDRMVGCQRLGEGAAEPAAAACNNRGHALRALAPSVVAIQMPANTATRPSTRSSVIGSPTSCWASRAAAIGLTVMVLATRVGEARCRAITHRMKASAPPATPR